MQPFARPVARTFRGQAWLGLDRTARPARTFRRPADTMTFWHCVSSKVPCINARVRFFSSQLPPKDTPKDTNAKSSEAKNSDPEDVEPLSSLISKLSSGSGSGSGSDIKSNNPSPDRKADSAERLNFKNNISLPELPSTLENYRGELNKRFSHLMDTLQARTMNASQALNDITGYTSIDHIKRQNAELEIGLAEAHERVRTARLAYKQANAKRSTTQREVTTLLARKDTWTPSDLERFTELYRTDHVLEGEVASSQESLTEAEIEEQSLSQRLNAGILKRYHEEQIWSDRIRRASTWGTWGLMGMNFLLFVVLQFIAEPWKRRRLVKGVVAEEKAVLDEVRAELEELKEALEKRVVMSQSTAQPIDESQIAHPIEPVVETPVQVQPDHSGETLVDAPRGLLPDTWEAWKEVLTDPEQWRPIAEDLYSERRIDLRMRDASLLALQGALAGAALAWSITLLLVRRS